VACDLELSPGVRSLYPEGYPPHFMDQVAFPALSQIVVGNNDNNNNNNNNIIMIVIWNVRNLEFSYGIQGVFKKRPNFCYKDFILQHFKHCPLQSSPLYWRYTVPNVSSIVGMLPGTHFL
jgi:hypothetical protein